MLNVELGYLCVFSHNQTVQPLQKLVFVAVLEIELRVFASRLPQCSATNSNISVELCGIMWNYVELWYLCAYFFKTRRCNNNIDATGCWLYAQASGLEFEPLDRLSNRSSCRKMI